MLIKKQAFEEIMLEESEKLSVALDKAQKDAMIEHKAAYAEVHQVVSSVPLQFTVIFNLYFEQ